MTFENLSHAFFLVASGQGIFMALVLFIKSKLKSGPAFYLAWVMMIFSIVLLFWLGYWLGYYDGPLQVTGLFFANFDLLLGPFIFLFVRSRLVQNFRLRKIDLLHFLPFLLYFVNHLNIISAILFEWRWYRITDTPEETLMFVRITQVLKHAQFVGYGIWLVIIAISKKTRWLRILSISYLIYCAGRIAYYVMVSTETLTLNIDYIISIIIVTAIYSTSYIDSINPERFRVRKSYQKSSLSTDHEHIISDQVSNHLKSNKVFLSSEFSLEDLSRDLQIPKHHISQALNHYLKKSYTELINELRVNHAIGLLQDPKRSNMKILTIALDSGFNNKVSFYQHFKRITGLSPKEYRSRHMSSQLKE